MKNIWKVVVALVLCALVCGVLFSGKLLAALNGDKTGWAVYQGEYYYRDGDGQVVTGWFSDGGVNYYLDASRGGARSHGLTKIGDDYYFFSGDGLILKGWQTDRGKRYFFDDNGIGRTGWFTENGKKYYFGEERAAYTGLKMVDDVYYYFDETGALSSGWKELPAERIAKKDEAGWTEIPASRCYIKPDGTAWIGWLETDEGFRYFGEDAKMVVGWLDIQDSTFYMDEDGLMVTGWQELLKRRTEKEQAEYEKLVENNDEIPNKYTDYYRYYFVEEDVPTTNTSSTGVMVTGWMQYTDANGDPLDDTKYYFLDDGRAAMGRTKTDSGIGYFSEWGYQIPFVNQWNVLTKSYACLNKELAYSGSVSLKIDAAGALTQMLNAAREAGCQLRADRGYIPYTLQANMFKARVADCGGDTAKARKLMDPAGESEHQLGLAVDLYPYSYTSTKPEVQAQLPAIQWLMEHSWEYGFILRYTEKDEAMTGESFNPNHYRYVGVELAKVLHDSNVCLEEYLDTLTYKMFDFSTSNGTMPVRAGGKKPVIKKTDGSGNDFSIYDSMTGAEEQPAETTGN